MIAEQNYQMCCIVMQMNGPVDNAVSVDGVASVRTGATKPWERVWTVAEMRSAAANWHLANDVGVRCSCALMLPYLL